MPLKAGAKNVGANIRELTENGSRPRSHKQIVAIALRAAGVGNAMKGKTMKQMASGQ